ncbi:MAG: hypothetical protein QM504_12840 [Pseudomonadota bacterium]
MSNTLKIFINLFSVLLFVTVLNAEAGRLKKVENNFSNLETAAQEVSERLDSIKHYLDEIDKPGSFLKKSFLGIDHAWYGSKSGSLAEVSTIYPLNLKFDQKNIRNVVLIKNKHKDWSIVIKLYFNALYDNGKLLFNNTSNKKIKRWYVKVKKDLRKKGVKKNKINEATDYYKKHVKQVMRLVSLKIYNKIDHLYENVYFKSLNRKKFSHLFYFDDKVGRRRLILKNISEHNDIIKNNKSILLAGTMHAAETVRKRTKHSDFQTYLGFGSSRDRGNIRLRVVVNKQKFKLAGKSKNEIYSAQSDFIDILDGYVANGAAVKSKIGEIVKYEDASRYGKYSGYINYDLESHMGEWVPPLWFSKEALERINSEYNKSHNKFINLALQYLESSFNETVRKFKITQPTTKQIQKNEF